MNKAIKSGLAVVLLATLNGCATVPYTETKVYEYERPPVVIKEEKNVIKNTLQEEIKEVKQDGYNLEVCVDETSNNVVRYNIEKSVQKVKQQVTSRGGSDSILGIECIGWTPDETIRGPEEEIGTYTKNEEREDTELVYSGPKSGIPVKFSSQYFKFNNLSNEAVINTNEQGVAAVTITSYPLFWRPTESEVSEAVNNNLSNQILDRSLKEKFFTSLQLARSSYKVEIETAKKGGMVDIDGSSVFQEIRNDKEEYNVNGWRADFAEAYNRVENIIKTDLESRCVSKINVQVRDVESHFPVDGAVVSLKTKKAPQLEDLIKEEEKIRAKYFAKGSELFEGTKVDPSYLLLDLDSKRISIPAEGAAIKSNIGAAYSVEIIHPDYQFLQGELAFAKDNQNKIIELLSLGSKIRRQDVAGKDVGIKESK